MKSIIKMKVFWKLEEKTFPVNLRMQEANEDQRERLDLKERERERERES